METWQVSVKDKKLAYGSMRIPIGGKTTDKDEEEGAA